MCASCCHLYLMLEGPTLQKPPCIRCCVIASNAQSNVVFCTGQRVACCKLACRTCQRFPPETQARATKTLEIRPCSVTFGCCTHHPAMFTTDFVGVWDLEPEFGGSKRRKCVPGMATYAPARGGAANPAEQVVVSESDSEESEDVSGSDQEEDEPSWIQVRACAGSPPCKLRQREQLGHPHFHAAAAHAAMR